MAKKIIIKKSMAVPLPDDIKRQMAKEGIFILLNKNLALPSLGKEKVQEILNGLKESGASSFFSELDVNTALQLPYIYKVNKDSLVEVDGRLYHVVWVTESKLIKKRQVINGVEYQKGDNYPGEVIFMDVESGNPVIFTYDEVKDKIRTPSGLTEETMVEFNQEVAEWNRKVEAIEKAAGPTKLNLQIAAAENRIKNRIKILETQKAALERAIEDPLSVSPGYGLWMEFLRNNYRNFGLRDIFDTMLFLYQSNARRLIEDIRNNTLQIPEEIRDGLIEIATQENMAKQEKDIKERTQEEEKETRKEEELPESKQVEEQPLRPFTLEDMPEKKYKTPTKYKTLYTWVSSLRRIIGGIEKDKRDLENIVNTFGGLRQYIAELEKGQRAMDYLRSPEGQNILDSLKRFLDASQTFLKRYYGNVVIDGKIDPKLLGRTGTPGNALIAVRLNNIYNIIRRTIADVEGVTTAVPRREPIEEPVTRETTETTEAFCDRVKKLSEVLWQVFEKRGLKK